MTKAADNTAEGAGESKFRRFRRLFPFLVFGSLAIMVVVEHSRPSRSELPVFEPTQRVALDPLAVPQGPLVLTGRVSTTDGTGANEVLVQLTQNSEPHWSYSDASGAFELRGLAAGEVEVTLVQFNTPPIRHAISLPADPVEWMLPAPYTPRDGLPVVKRSALFGRVQSPLGAPVEACQLVLEPTEFNQPFSAVSLRRVPLGNGGVFAIADLALGHYRAYVLPEWAAGGTWPHLVDLEYEHNSSARDLAITLNSGELEGTLVLAGEGSALAGALVTLRSAADPNQLWEPLVTDESGYFLIRDLPPGHYRLEIRAGDELLKKSVSIPARRRVSIDFDAVRLSD